MTTPKKALLVASDQGFHWDELADVYHAFDDAHWRIELGSPFGHPKVEPLSLRKSKIRHIFGRATTKARLPQTPVWGRPVVEAIMRTKRLDSLDPKNYGAIYVCGGLGDMDDIEGDIVLAGLISWALKHGVAVGGRARVLASYRDIFDALKDADEVHQEHAPLFKSRSPRGARRVVARILKFVCAPEVAPHMIEFLDRKSGRVLRERDL